jgi:hypothetical protein
MKAEHALGLMPGAWGGVTHLLCRYPYILRIADCGLCLGDYRNGHFHSFGTDRELGPLAGRRIHCEPFDPFLVHAGEIRFLREYECCADNFGQRAAGGFENGGYVPEALRRLFLNGASHHFTGARIEWSLPGNEHQARCQNALTEAGRGFSMA